VNQLRQLQLRGIEAAKEIRKTPKQEEQRGRSTLQPLSRPVEEVCQDYLPFVELAIR
jgi:hypothetical protein